MASAGQSGLLQARWAADAGAGLPRPGRRDVAPGARLRLIARPAMAQPHRTAPGETGAEKGSGSMTWRGGDRPADRSCFWDEPSSPDVTNLEPSRFRRCAQRRGRGQRSSGRHPARRNRRHHDCHDHARQHDEQDGSGEHLKLGGTHHAKDTKEKSRPGGRLRRGGRSRAAAAAAIARTRGNPNMIRAITMPASIRARTNGKAAR